MDGLFFEISSSIFIQLTAIVYQNLILIINKSKSLYVLKKINQLTMRNTRPSPNIRIRKIQPKGTGQTTELKLQVSKNAIKELGGQKRPKMKRQIGKKQNKKKQQVLKKDQMKKKAQKGKSNQNQAQKMILAPKFIPIIKAKYGLHSISITLLNGGHESMSILVKTPTQNYVFKTQNLRKYRLTLKHFQVQDRVLSFLEENSIKGNPEVQDVMNYPKLVKTVDGKTTFSVKIDNTLYSGRMVTFLQGRTMGYSSYHQLGKQRMRAVGILQRDLKGFEDNFDNRQQVQLRKKFLSRQKMAYLQTTKKLRNIYHVAKNPKFNKLIINQPQQKIYEILGKQQIYIQQFIKGYQSNFLDKLAYCRKSLCHKDLHGLNLIMNEKKQKITGVIDFGWTMKYSYFFSELRLMFGTQLRTMPPGITKENFINTICGYVKQYSRNCRCSRQDIEVIYYCFGSELLSRNVSQYFSNNKLTSYGRLAWYYVKTDPEQLMGKMQSVCEY